MRIRSVGINNFRCLENVEVNFDPVTTFIGPNGAGKSSILRALDWFLNGDRHPLTKGDLYAGVKGPDAVIRVRVTFDNLSDSDRKELGSKYAPDGVDSFTVWRTWQDEKEKITGKAFAFPGFETVRNANSAADKKIALASLLKEEPDLELPQWITMARVSSAMDDWEREHPDLLKESQISDTHCFGFAGSNKLSGLFDYVLVTADLRASEESVDARSTIIGRILERAIDRSKINEALGLLADEVAARQDELHTLHLKGQLDKLASELSSEIGAFAKGRTVQLRPAMPDLKDVVAKVAVSIADDKLETTVDRQGHGFQRTLLVSALKLLAKRAVKGENESVICLAIEEPELFQHPTQARVFARVLRDLANDLDNGLEVVYATHSPYFIEPRYFDQIRRVDRQVASKDQHATVQVHHACMKSVVERLEGCVSDTAVKSRFDQICIKQLAEAFFANAVVLVEGETDKAMIEGVSARSQPLALDGISVVPVQGKSNLVLPHAILVELGLPTLVVFDNDEGCGKRMLQNGRKNHEIQQQMKKMVKDNHDLCRYLQVEQADSPAGRLSNFVFAVPDTLESAVESTWIEWEECRKKIASEGRGVDGKNAATYAMAAQECTEVPVDAVYLLVGMARDMTGVANDTEKRRLSGAEEFETQTDEVGPLPAMLSP